MLYSIASGPIKNLRKPLKDLTIFMKTKSHHMQVDMLFKENI